LGNWHNQLQMVLDTKKIKGQNLRTRHLPNGVTLPKVFVNINGIEESTAFNDTTWLAPQPNI